MLDLADLLTKIREDFCPLRFSVLTREKKSQVLYTTRRVILAKINKQHDSSPAWNSNAYEARKGIDIEKKEGGKKNKKLLTW